MNEKSSPANFAGLLSFLEYEIRIIVEVASVGQVPTEV